MERRQDSSAFLPSISPIDHHSSVPFRSLFALRRQKLGGAEPARAPREAEHWKGTVMTL